MPASKLNWEAIKAEYISGEDSVTHQALADKHGCARQVVTRHAKGWDAARLQYRSQTVAKTLNRISTTEAELRAKQLRVSDALLSKGLTAMQTLNPTTYAEALRTVETALEQARKAAGLTDRSEVAHELGPGTGSKLDRLLAELASRRTGGFAEGSEPE